MSRLKLMQRSWTEAAVGYEEHIVPRFMPWTKATLKAFQDCGLPRGVIIVPACGPGQELPMLAEAFPDNDIVGVDLAEGMIDLAKRVIERFRLARVTAEVGDATSLAELARGRPVAGIYSCFGLQQMPKPAETLRGWAELLAPGGALAVTYWPHIVEAAGPWRCLTDLTVGAADWQAGIPQVALRARGVQLVSDSLPAFDMVWPSADAFFEIMCTAGPWRARVIQYGEEHMEDVRQKFMAQCPEVHAKPLRHTPEARMIVLRREREAKPRL